MGDRVPLPPLSDAETLRYNRQIVLRGFDFDGQERLKGSRVLIVGLGGLGCAAAQYLAAAGVGHLTLLDFDTVSLSNLQRQILHTDARIGMDKVASAQEALAAINPHIRLTAIARRLDDVALAQQIAQADAVLDCTDSVESRESLNRLCRSAAVPLISGAAIRMEGQVCIFTYQPGEPCYRCLSRLFGANALTCVEAGVMSPLVGIIGATQAMECIKLLCHFGEIPRGRLMLYDAMASQWRSMALTASPACEICGSQSVS
ncbi:molybdopterin-synthase adenylyltransferase MoeB [Edwardsiella ictaluri]|uniref:Molybdopterin-synthase adenylyltransferase MoeB n=1 Tax=Edwardsiella ictaluri TaxID=67780 RepID=A0ABY8GEC8_EDWIC|nr:molybdopterin-synthase adenylyltransferase MoeB [Edwardsiella ictaluri]AVZ81200.1 molybdopterin-synthase adenylyltransferase MoeB [Edwardsiella ictaluri]EKS7763814.1 molybdopterin-synthase adenylyltransferase MoeB [Edwardsiella ictaluri]EKS7770596.1 molybdopterin-synthase adenylyltransferase MoeB [Edwardsiella ictaluri]EKS7773738.1 molybdopterin-synthase adenylyltransferase MoeB [Edwardsiella ictaluri]EKS7777106.1 molybdopterin-synthase adenylyltransferase MoeB [Edwardsiella ictaluri]